MSCFWDGLINGITTKEFKQHKFTKTPKVFHFIQYLMQNNRLVNTVTWNDESISEKSQQENYDWIAEYKPHQYHNGTDCSSCNPFIILFCDIFEVSVLHKYNMSIIKYVNTKKSIKTISFMSDQGHFWIGSFDLAQYEPKKKKKNKKNKR